MLKKYRRFNCARPSFLEGMARVLDMGGTLNVYHRLPVAKPTAQEDTVIALRRHWVAVGQHMRNAIGEFERVERSNIKEASQRND